MNNHAIFSIVQNIASLPLVIKDENCGKSVTNDAEYVTQTLFDMGWLPNGRRLFYYDTDGSLDELMHENGVFKDFKVLNWDKWESEQARP